MYCTYAAGRRRTAVDRSVLTERIRTALNATEAWNQFTPTINEIADGIYRISTWVPDVSPDGLHVQPVPRHRRRAAAVPHRAARDVPPRRRGGGHGRTGRVAALDHVRPRRGRRVRGDEHVARRRAEQRRSPTARSDASCRSTTSATARRGRSRRARCSTSAASACVRSRHRTCRTAGRHRCCSRRRRARCCAATCSPRSAPARPSPIDDIVEPGVVRRGACSTPPHWRRTPRRHSASLGDLDPTTLALMHGPSFQGDGRRALYDLAAAYEATMVPS